MRTYGANPISTPAGIAPLAPSYATTSTSPLNVGDVFVLVVPMLQFVQFKLVGTLFATDLLLLGILPVVVLRSMNRLRKKQVAIILLLGLGWLLSQVLTDVIRQSEPVDYLRGWSKVGLTVTHLAVIWILIRGTIRRFVLYGAGVCAGGVLSVLLFPNEYQIAEPWKFGLAMPVTLAVVMSAAWLSKGRRRSIVLCALMAMSVVNLFLNFRSLALICMLTAVYTYLFMHGGARRKSGGKLKMVIATAAVLLSVVAFQQAYKYAIGSGWLGRDAQSKYEQQQAGEGGILLGGRSEILSSAEAIFDSPVIGHGSWARDPKYVAILRERQAELGYKRGYENSDDLIPSHSHIFGAWVEAGVLGALFWFWILKLTLTTLSRVTGSEPLLPVFGFIALLLCWDVLFSPYGAERRFLTTYFISGILLFHYMQMSVAQRKGLVSC